MHTRAGLYGTSSIQLNLSRIMANGWAEAIEVAGEENVIEGELGMGGEDFSYFSLEAPSCFFRCGTRNEDRGIVWGHHHPKFDTEEEGFINGMATMAAAAMKYLNEE